jgi:putative hydrolase of the HAD superfamily
MKLQAAKLKAVLFDLGGTLLHYHDPASDEPQRPYRRITHLGFESLMRQIAAQGIDVPPAEVCAPVFDRHIGESIRALMPELRGGNVETPIRAALDELGIAIDDSRWSDFRAHFYNTIDTIVTPRIGAQETLAALKEAGYKIGLISNTYWAADMHDRHLAQFGLIDYFDVRIFSADTAHIKPHPSIFSDTLLLMNVDAPQAVYVGDRPDNDVLGAKQVGMYAVLIRSPYMTDPLGDAVPDATIDELPDLIPALAALEGLA